MTVNVDTQCANFVCKKTLEPGSTVYEVGYMRFCQQCVTTVRVPWVPPQRAARADDPVRPGPSPAKG